MRTAQIIKGINHPHVRELVRSDGYWYFVYDSGDVYETKSVMTPRLNDLSLEDWVDTGKQFAADVDSEDYTPY